MRFGPGFWFGAFILLAGVSLILDAVFHIRIPVVRTGFGLLLIYFGVRVVAGGWAAPMSWPESAAIMADQRFEPTQVTGESLKYDVIFGRGVVDLTHLPPLQRDLRVEVNAIFGGAVVMFDPSVPIEIDATSAFGGARLPDNSGVAFGDIHYRGPARAEAGPRIYLKVSTVFGGAEVREGPGSAGPTCAQPAAGHTS